MPDERCGDSSGEKSSAQRLHPRRRLAPTYAQHMSVRTPN